MLEEGCEQYKLAEQGKRRSKVFRSVLFLQSNDIKPKSESIAYIIRFAFDDCFKPLDNLDNSGNCYLIRECSKL